jgi:23S rRNA (cytidine1920-2'-O)/16S rRNA (cytidine1409-2'-O)-methyltransferase
MRADVYLVENGYVKSRAKACEMIERGFVEVNGALLTKKNKEIKEGDNVVLREELRFVGRGGDKLAGALSSLGVSVEGYSCLDIGSSTGGFTDCLLQAGAKHVTAVDVGSEQFDTILANNLQIELHEKTDIRMFQTERQFDLTVADVSFISWINLVPTVSRLSQSGTKILLLIKPQFEVGKGDIKHGIVKDAVLHKEVCDAVYLLFETAGFASLRIIESSLRGGDGNQEFFLYGEKI